MSESDRFEGLKYLIQYRRTDGLRWHNMAAFDVIGAAERYFENNTKGSEEWPWEYQMVDLETGVVTSNERVSK